MAKRRCIIAVLIFLAFAAGLVLRLMNFQLVHGRDYLVASDKTTVKTIPIEAPRGEILDTNGRALAVNKTVYCVQLDLVFMPREERNDIILRLIDIIDEHGEEYYDELPVTQTFPYSFTDNSEGLSIRIKNLLGLDKTPTSANTLIAELKTRYKIPTGYTEAQARRVCGVRYTMELRGANLQTPYIFAQDVSTATVTTVKENSAQLSGTDIVTRAVRQYYYGDAAPDIVGIVGMISDTELEKYREKGYSSSDYVGKFGVELSCEEYLRGTPGEMQVVLNSRGQVVSREVTKEAVPGSTVVLTIDIELQRAVRELIKTRIDEIAEQYAETDGFDCSAGSAVLTDVNTGAVLTAVNFPSYDLENYYSDYSELIAADGNPMFNRAMRGLYPPGSTFKPITALAALETGKLTPTTTYTCNHSIYYANRSYSCTGTHGRIDVVTAIAKSCNVFFYQVGLSTGFDPIREYAAYFGLGSETGIEVGENAGQVSETNILMTAIGQANTLASPLQLSRYMATLANGGTLYKSTVIKSVMSYDFTKSLRDCSPQVLGTVPHGDTAWEAVTHGLYAGVNERQASYYTAFADAEYKVASKTGTAQISSGSANGMFICYAPYDKPQVALSIALEHAGGGARCAPLARKILDKYFELTEWSDRF